MDIGCSYYGNYHSNYYHSPYGDMGGCDRTEQTLRGLMRIKTHPGTSLVVQWLRICLPMQGTRVRALVQEDPTCRGATKPMRHNY